MKKPFKNPFRHHRAKNRNKPRGYSPTQIICVSFVIVIALGTLLLSLPIASRYGRMRVIDAMFTATSATCVTGLVVRDTWTQFTVFGQAVILVLIQVGGLGLVTLTSFFALAMRRRMGFRDLRVLGESVSADGYAQAKDVLKIVVGLAACFEGAGILLLMLAFVPQFGLQGIWISIFTAISAFCNAGFDLFGQFGAYSSLVPYVHNYYVQAVVMFMIIAGGLGFMVWVELIQYPKKRKLSLHARVVLIFSVLLWVGGAALIGLMEWNNPASMGGLSVSDKIMASLFQSVSTRTAGMNTIDLAACGPITKLLMSVLQFIYDNIMYAELNTKSDYCQVCGYDGEIQILEDRDGKLVWTCPNCGNTDQDKMNVARRTCGYIGTQFWNQGRTQEIKERVLHL